MRNQFLEAGKIVGTHGVRGTLRVEPWCDSPAFLKQFKTFYLDKGATPVSVAASHPHGKQFLLSLKDVETVEAADRLRGKILYLSRDDAKLPEGSFFVQDLIGMDVFDQDTFLYYGTLTDVIQTGANDVYQITSPDHKNYLIPAVPQVVREISMEKNKMLILPPEGIFDDED